MGNEPVPGWQGPVRVRAWQAPGPMPHPPPAFGLCDLCAHQKLVKSGRGSQFSMCLLGVKDPNWPKYPPMPVSACPRFEREVGQSQV